MLVRHLQDIFCFLFGDQSRVASVFREGAGDVVKGETGLQRSVLSAGNTEMEILVAAVADPDADVFRFLNDMRGFFIVQDMVGLFRQKHRLLDKHAPQLCLHAERRRSLRRLLQRSSYSSL